MTPSAQLAENNEVTQMKFIHSVGFDFPTHFQTGDGQWWTRGFRGWDRVPATSRYLRLARVFS